MKNKVKLLIVTIFFSLGLVFSQEQVIEDRFLFKSGEFDLSPEVKEELKQMLYDSEGENFVIEATGYTDNVGTIKSNKYLSKLRAENVKTFLETICLKIKSAKSIGFGEISPYDGKNEKLNDANRRVDIVVKYNKTEDRENLINTREACLRGEYTGPKSSKKVINITVPEVVVPAPATVPTPTPAPVVNKVNSVNKLSSSLLKKEEIRLYDEEIPQFKELSTGDKIVLRGINFKPGSDEILKTSDDVLKELLGLMMSSATLKIEISGHVCCGIPKNQKERLEVNKLSEDRAFAVLKYLVINGIDESRITHKGMGFMEPLVPEEKTPSDEVKNRRVEIKIIKK